MINNDKKEKKLFQKKTFFSVKCYKYMKIQTQTDL